MTPIQINGCDTAVCKWILWLEATEFPQMILKERNDSIPVIRLLSFHFQLCQACSFVLGFIPLMGQPACLLPQLVHAHCSQGRGWLDSLALNDFLCGLGWIFGQDRYHEEMDQMPTLTQLPFQSDSLVLTFLTKRYLLVHFKPSATYTVYSTLGDMATTNTAVYIYSFIF